MKKGVALDNIEIVDADAKQAAVVARTLRWSWPQPLDFTPYAASGARASWGVPGCSRRCAPGRWRRAQLIEAEYGVGKSAFLAELVDTRGAGVPVVAQHFCQFDAIATLAPGRFVSSIAAQLAAALPAYRAPIEAEEAAGLRQLLEAPDNDPIPASEDIHKPLSEPIPAYRSPVAGTRLTS